MRRRVGRGMQSRLHYRKESLLVLLLQGIGISWEYLGKDPQMRKSQKKIKIKIMCGASVWAQDFVYAKQVLNQ